MRLALLPEIADILKQLKEFLPTLVAAAEEVTALLQQGETARGMRGLAELVTGLQTLERVLDFLCASCRAELPELEGARGRIEAVFPSLLAAIEEEDPVAIGDVLSYELVPALASCREELPGW